MSSYKKIDFELILYENRFGPNGGYMRGIICPFCGWREDVEVPRLEPEGTPNFAREKMEKHWGRCEKFPS